MEYREIAPPALLRRYLECFWLLRSGSAPETTASERILPDGCIELILNLGEPFAQYAGEGPPERQPRRFVVGQMDRFLLIQPCAAADMIGVRFRPAGAAAFFRFPVDELTGQVLPLEEVARDFSADLGAVEERRATEGRLELLAERLTRRLLAGRGAAPQIEAAAEEILRSGGRTSVAALARGAGWSVRHLERRFRQAVGLPPKLLCRILRFQGVFRAVKRAGRGWAAVAAECGFYDQAHFIKEARQFSGLTPQALFPQLSPVTEQFTRRGR